MAPDTGFSLAAHNHDKPYARLQLQIRCLRPIPAELTAGHGK